MRAAFSWHSSEEEVTSQRMQLLEVMQKEVSILIQQNFMTTLHCQRGDKGSTINTLLFYKIGNDY